jgi:hypothetical protein
MACMSAPYAAARAREEAEKKLVEQAARVKRFPAPVAPSEAIVPEVRIAGGLPVQPTVVGAVRRRRVGSEIRSDR